MQGSRRLVSGFMISQRILEHKTGHEISCVRKAPVGVTWVCGVCMAVQFVGRGGGDYEAGKRLIRQRQVF